MRGKVKNKKKGINRKSPAEICRAESRVKSWKSGVKRWHLIR